MSTAHTPGPWRWEFNEKHKGLHLVGGKPMYDLTIIDFERWGMNKATMRMRDTAHDGFDLMFRVHERQDWIAPEPGREHHKHWHQLLDHPDANLIAAAPELLEALKSARKELHACQAVIHLAGGFDPAYVSEAQIALKVMDAAIAKATGVQS